MEEELLASIEKLDMVTVWIQLHHLSMEFWTIKSLENLGSLSSRVLKIDDHTLNVNVPSMNVGRAKYARLCVELDLSKPLRQQIWVGVDEDEALVAVLYENLPSFTTRDKAFSENFFMSVCYFTTNIRFFCLKKLTNNII